MAWLLEHRRFLGAGGAAVLATALLAAWLGWGLGGEGSMVYASDLGTLLAAVAATAICLHAGLRQVGWLRLHWCLLAAACGAWALAEGIWAIYELILRVEVPIPSWADVGYLGAFPLAVGALLCHPAMREGRARQARGVFDGLLVATALLFLSWTFVLGPLWQSSDLTTAGGLVALAYPFGDVVIVCLTVLVVRGMTGGDRLALWCLLSGLVTLALADSTYVYLTGVKGYETGTMLDVVWVAGYLAIAVGAFSSNGQGHAKAESSELTLGPLAVPLIPMLVALVVIGIEVQLGYRPDSVALVIAFALVVLVLVRQVLLLFDCVAPTGRCEGGLAVRLQTALLGADPEDYAIESSPTPEHSPP